MRPNNYDPICLKKEKKNVEPIEKTTVALCNIYSFNIVLHRYNLVHEFPPGLITRQESVRTRGEQLACAQEADCEPHDGGLVQVSTDAVG